VSAASSPSTLATSPTAIGCRLASSKAEIRAHFELRRAVFVAEQRLFAQDDRDGRDTDAGTLHAVGYVNGVPSGAVRLYEIDSAARLWKGDRLAVLPDHRANHLGAQLVRFAVCTAGWLGGSTMIAHVQVPNVRFFEHLGWRADGQPAPFHGVMHQLMSIGLTRGASVPGAGL
jgi:putative N-acetyltransferase (TIGR04045 family)